jgi:predicted thioesterase
MDQVFKPAYCLDDMMKTTLQAGIAGKRAFRIGRDSTIGFMGEDARVYATPMLVRDIEVTCRDLLLEHLDPGEDSVGTRVELDHLAPSLEGAEVTIDVKLAELRGRAAVFEVAAFEKAEKIGQGRHSRFIVDVAKTKERLQKKRAAA